MNANTPASVDQRGLLAAIVAFAMWGVFPLYWHALRTVPAWQIIAHRVIWCGLFVVGYLTITQGVRWLQPLRTVPRIGWMLLTSSILISLNWGIFIWAVTNGHVVDSSLGYFINPLMNVVIGVLFLGERLSRAQWTAVCIATLGVLWLALSQGSPPWIALALALSFAFYGLIRKVAAVDAMPGLAIESLFLLLPAIAWLLWEEWHGVGSFGHEGSRLDFMLILGGLLTALPLIGFAYGARRISYSLIGILQYLAPSLQLLSGIWILGEVFTRDQFIGFSCIWFALAIYAADGMLRARRNARNARKTAHCDEHVPPSDGAAPLRE